MKNLQKAAVGWGAFILIAIGIANASTPSSNVQVPQTTVSVQQQSTVTTPTTNVHKTIPAPIKSYVNSSGNTVQSPTYYSSKPTGATAICRDGTYSFSQHRRGTCSHHGGVDEWL